MTKPGTIRWKRVPSKNFLRTSAANDAVVHGESLTSSAKAKTPRFVWAVTVYVFVGSSAGMLTRLPVTGQAPIAPDRASGGEAVRVWVTARLLPPPPQPAKAATAATAASPLASDSRAARATWR